MTPGINRRFLELARAGYLELGVSDAILDEIQDVLVRKFLSEEDALEARAHVESITRRVRPKRHIRAVADDPDDDAILECAVTILQQCSTFHRTGLVLTLNASTFVFGVTPLLMMSKPE